MLAPWLEQELSSVPEIATFATVDELRAEIHRLARQHPEVAAVRRIGTSRLGDPLECLTIGGGSADAVVFGLPHPNEPIGGLTALHLARRLCEDPGLRADLDHTWHIVACIDPDGLRLNEGWLKGPFTREHYSRNMYRPAGDEQIEWTFPFSYKQAYFDAVLPETLALMRLFDEVEPALMCSLHNSEMGGVYYYISRPEPRLHPVLQEIPERLGLSLDRGEPEGPWITPFADGIYKTLALEDGYDYQERTGGDVSLMAGGNSSDSYTRRFGTFTLVSELPYWDDERVSDDSPTSTSYAAALRLQAKGVRDLVEVLDETLQAVGRDLSADSPFLRATRYFAASLASAPEEAGRRADHKASQRPATVAELASLDDVVHSYRLRYAGMLLRALDGELAIGNATPTIRQRRALLADRYAGWCVEARAANEAKPIPIRSLVATQYAALVATARHLADKRRTAVPEDGTG